MIGNPITGRLVECDDLAAAEDKNPEMLHDFRALVPNGQAEHGLARRFSGVDTFGGGNLKGAARGGGGHTRAAADTTRTTFSGSNLGQVRDTLFHAHCLGYRQPRGKPCVATPRSSVKVPIN